MKQKILQKFNLSDDKIISIYPYGSRVYKTDNDKSDYDFWVICKNNVYSNLFAEKRENISIHLYDENTFMEFLNQNKLPALECIYLPKELLLKYTKSFKFQPDIAKLQVNVAEKTKRDLHLAQSRFENGDFYMAKKSIFHAMRTADFGKQIQKHGKIVNYSSTTHIWKLLIENTSEQWADYQGIMLK